MLIYKEITPDLLQKSSCALGMFDGVHRGHQRVIGTAKKMALVYDCPCVVLTFSAHPQFITASTPTPQITTLNERLDLFEQEGVDISIALDFNKEFSQITAEQYLKNMLVGGLNMRSVSIGYDHQFGKGKRGNQFFLKEFAEEFNYDVQIVPPVTVEGQIVSSSIIRKILKYGDIRFANKLLGREFKISGVVETGAKRGRTLGYPTANVKPEENVVVPACGVYSVEIQLMNTSVKYPAVLNIGYRPTFADVTEPTLEAFIIGFDQDIYGENVSVTFKSRIRDEKKFSSPEELVKQIQKDIEYVEHTVKQSFY